MILKFDAFLRDLAQFRERKNLITAAVSQDRSVPIHESVQSAKMFDHIESGSNEQVIRVAESDLRVQLAQFSWADPFHGTLRSDRHKRRRIDHAVRGRQSASPRFRFSILCEKLKHAD